MKKIVQLLGIFGLGAMLSLSAWALSSDEQAAIAERIKPVGKVCLQGDDSCGGAAVAAAPAAPKSGDEVYNSACTACHAAGVAGAPVVGDAAAWAPRIAQGMETVYSHAINGFNGMPPRGTCMSCSDDEIKAAVDYMVGKSQ